LKRIEESQLATTFAIHEARVTVQGDGWRVGVRGARQSWSRGQYLGEDRVRYTVDVARTPPSDLNPWGLQVSGLQLEREGPRGGLPSQGATRAVEARGDPIVLRLGFQRMAQVQFSADIQQVITAFTKQQVSMETVGPRLFLSTLEPDLSGELFVTLSGGSTLT